MPRTKLNVAMIGSGFIANVHSNAFRQVGHFFDVPYDVCCKVICGRDRSKLEKTASRWGWDELETDWQKVVTRSDIDAVDIAVPNALHAAIAIAARSAGIAAVRISRTVGSSSRRRLSATRGMCGKRLMKPASGCGSPSVQ